MNKERKQKEQHKEDRLARTRQRIRGACSQLHMSVLSPLLANVTLVECDESDSDVQIGCVSPSANTLWVNPHRRQELGEAEWTFILAHLLLHLGLGHGDALPDKHALLWTLACEHAADNLALALRLGNAPHDYGVDTAFVGMTETAIYDLLADDKRALANVKTYAGASRPDIVHRTPRASTSRATGELYQKGEDRRDYEMLLAEGIRMGVERAVEEAADTLGQATEDRTKTWRPLENAKRWVMNELPLLGALAAQLRVITDSKLCDRMDIPVAAVNAGLGEVYFHTGRGLSQEEVLFVYVHELLHVALLHHARLQGRDPYLWNVAADFVINGWLIEMGVGQFPHIGGLYDPRLKGMSAEEVYDLLGRDPRKCKNLVGFGGKKGDILLDERRIYKGEPCTLDDVYRRCMASGLACQGYGRGFTPAGLIEEIKSLFTPPVPWDVELARWMDVHVPIVRETLRSYGRASRRQASTPDIPRPARYVPQEWRDACTFGVVLDTSGSMDRELLGRALGAIASYAEAREVPAVRLVQCDAAPYDKGFLAPTDLRGIFPIQGRGGTVLQPAINYLLNRPDFPGSAPVMIITDGWCEEELLVPRDHCFVMPRKGWKEGAIPLRTSAPIFRVLKPEQDNE